MKETNIHNQTNINQNWNPASGRSEYYFTFVFATKAEYLEFRRLWKANYAALAALIRNLKQQIKDTMRQQAYAGKLQSELCKLRIEATVQLSMRHAAKVEAARQWEVARQTAL